MSLISGAAAQQINTAWLKGKTFISQTGDLFEFKQGSKMTFLQDYETSTGYQHTYSFQKDTLHVVRTYYRIGGIDRLITERYRFRVLRQGKDDVVLKPLDVLRYHPSFPDTLILTNITKKARPLRSFTSYSHEENHTLTHMSGTDSTGEFKGMHMTRMHIHLDRSRTLMIRRSTVIFTFHEKDTTASVIPSYEKKLKLTQSQYNAFLQNLSNALVVETGSDSSNRNCLHPFSYTLVANGKTRHAVTCGPITSAYYRFLKHVFFEYQLKVEEGS